MNCASVAAPSVEPEIPGVPASSVTVDEAMSTTRIASYPSNERSAPAVAGTTPANVSVFPVEKRAFVPTPSA